MRWKRDRLCVEKSKIQQIERDRLCVEKVRNPQAHCGKGEYA